MNQEYVMSFGLSFLKAVGFNPFNPGISDYLKSLLLTSMMMLVYGLNLSPMIVEFDGIQSLEDSIDSIPAGHQVKLN